MVLMVKTRVVQHHLETRDGETSIVILVTMARNICFKRPVPDQRTISH